MMFLHKLLFFSGWEIVVKKLNVQQNIGCRYKKQARALADICTTLWAFINSAVSTVRVLCLLQFRIKALLAKEAADLSILAWVQRKDLVMWSWSVLSCVCIRYIILLSMFSGCWFVDLLSSLQSQVFLFIIKHSVRRYVTYLALLATINPQ